VRRLVPVLLSLAFAATLHASVPSASEPAKFNQISASTRLDDSRAKEKLALTAAPADSISFYLEFYGTEQLPAKAQHKGLLHWFASTVKKTAQKVAFFSN